jgi:hypothetical protein
MGEDEGGTIETLKKYRAFSSLIEQFRGRVVDSSGDNVLTEFGSAVDAVESEKAEVNAANSRMV